MLSGWIGDIASSELEFSRAMQMLRNYSLVEVVAETASYATHPVVHQWAHHSQGKCFAIELSRLAVVAVGWSVPASSTRDYSTLQRRLLPHAQACFKQIVKSEADWWLSIDKEDDRDIDEGDEQETVLDAIHILGILYLDQGKLGEAEQMYERALRGYEEALGPNHTSTLQTVNNLGLLYAGQGKLGEAEQMYKRALRGTEEALGPNHTSTLQTVNNLGSLYQAQGKLGEAEQMYKRALRGYENALGEEGVRQYIPALDTLENMGGLYTTRAETPKAHAMYVRALSGLSSVLGQSSERCINLAAKINALPHDRRKENGRHIELLTVGKGSASAHDRRKKSLRLSMRKLIRKVL